MLFLSFEQVLAMSDSIGVRQDSSNFFLEVETPNTMCHSVGCKKADIFLRLL